MSFDNRQFVVNGEMENREMFNAALSLVCNQEEGWYQKSNPDYRLIKGYKIDPKKGFVLYWACSDGDKEMLSFPFGSAVDQVADFVWAWLKSKPKTEAGQWEDNAYHDGHNDIGWKIYCEDWGQVEGHSYAFAAVKPVYLWYGK